MSVIKMLFLLVAK